MYLAELHGKFHPSEERKEDILTSNVFSFFKYAKREVFLHNLLLVLGVRATKNEIIDADFIFWPKYEDGTEPDLVIIVGRNYLLFEAKLHSGFGKSFELDKYQMLREIKGGELEAHNMGKEFMFIPVTAHYAQNKFLEENPYIKKLNFRWINWHQIALLVSTVLNSGVSLDIETINFAEDLYALFLRMKLRKYAGKEVLTSLINLRISPEYLFFDPTTSEHRGDFIGFMHTLGDYQKLIRITDPIIIRRNPSFFNFDIIDYLFKEIDIVFYKR